jgi:hypothetical protein
MASDLYLRQSRVASTRAKNNRIRRCSTEKNIAAGTAAEMYLHAIHTR